MSTMDHRTSEHVLDLADLGMDRGGHLLVDRALRTLEAGERLLVAGNHEALGVHLQAWCRAKGHAFEPVDDAPRIAAAVRRGSAEVARWHDAEIAGAPDPTTENAVAEHPSPQWGLAMRGARVEPGMPAFSFPLSDKNVVWSDDAAHIYAQAAAAQWDPDTAIDWTPGDALAPELEAAVVQVMTYLIENETAALVVPARFLGQVHPHFREVLQVLAIQVADEARHIEVFARRAGLNGESVGSSTVGGQMSLKTLLDEPDFALATFLLSVLGEGSFLPLLQFIAQNAPDPVTRQVTQLAAQDEARHVAFGMSHLKRHLQFDPSLRGRMAMAVEQRHHALSHTAGLNEEVFDALLLLAAGSLEPEAVGSAFDRVVALKQEMDGGRRRRMATLGFTADEAEALSSLHTRNFM